MTATEHCETVIIGAGQAGLATGYHLHRQGRPFVILEASDRVGDIWRNRFDSLRLYSPARYAGLPGFPFPADPWSYPTRDEMADYLEAYAERFELPVRTGITVSRLSRQGDRYLVSCADQVLEADNVVVASGTFQTPVVPEFAPALAPSIRQLHSGAYRNPAQLQEGPVLVVGASHSGADIAYEVARDHLTVLSGKVHGELPFRIDRRPARVIFPLIWFAWNHVLNERTPIGRKVRPEVRAHGGPLIRVKKAHLAEAGVERSDARVVGVQDGKPLLEDGLVLDVTNVIWCTGFGKDSDWIDLPVDGPDGWPEQSRGVSPVAPGLYFVGLPFLYAFASMLVGGVGRDADRVAEHIARRALDGSEAEQAEDVEVAA